MAELFSKLGIDWKLLVANTITFFIVLWVLRKYAFGPLLRVIEQRQRTAADTAVAAEQIERETTALAAGKAQILAAAKADALTIVQSARRDAETAKDAILSDAQAEATAMLDRTRQAMAREKEAMVRAARADLADLVVMATEKVTGGMQDGVNAALAAKAVEAVGKAKR